MTHVLIVVVAVILNNYIKQETQRDWLLEKYSTGEIIVIDSNDEDEDNETLASFMLSHLDREMDSFQEGLTNLIWMALKMNP